MHVREHLHEDFPRRLEACPLGCGIHPKLQARLVEVHCRTECPMRAVVCALCGDGIPAGALEQHKEADCPMRMAGCDHRGCYKRLPQAEMPRHMSQECRKRQVFCLQGCGLTIFADKRKAHHERSCPMRYVPCPLGCPQPVRESDRLIHIESTCVRRAGTK